MKHSSVFARELRDIFLMPRAGQKYTNLQLAQRKVREIMKESQAICGTKRPTKHKVIKDDFYKGIEWFACWLLDNVEGETITEEALRPWAVKALKSRPPTTPKRKGKG